MSNVAIIQPPRQTPMWTTVSFFFVAGLATLAVLRTVHPVFEVDKQYQIQGLGASDETWSAYIAQQRLVDTKNTALLVGVLGGTLGMALAFIRPATGRLAWRLIIGTVAGALVGFMAGSVAYYLQLYYAVWLSRFRIGDARRQLRFQSFTRQRASRIGSDGRVDRGSRIFAGGLDSVPHRRYGCRHSIDPFNADIVVAFGSRNVWLADPAF